MGNTLSLSPNMNPNYLMDNYKEVYFDAISKINSKSQFLYEKINEVLSVFSVFKTMDHQECSETFVVINKNQKTLPFTTTVYPIIPNTYSEKDSVHNNKYNNNNKIENKKRIGVINDKNEMNPVDTNIIVQKSQTDSCHQLVPWGILVYRMFRAIKKNMMRCEKEISSIFKDINSKTYVLVRNLLQLYGDYLYGVEKLCRQPDLFSDPRPIQSWIQFEKDHMEQFRILYFDIKKSDSLDQNNVDNEFYDVPLKTYK